MKPWEIDRLTDADIWGYAEPETVKPAQVAVVNVVDQLRKKGWTTEQIQAKVDAAKAKRRPQRNRERRSKGNG